jgi:uncharacterized repeat protein (TIGR02543 family)
MKTSYRTTNHINVSLCRYLLVCVIAISLIFSFPFLPPSDTVHAAVSNTIDLSKYNSDEVRDKITIASDGTSVTAKDSDDNLLAGAPVATGLVLTGKTEYVKIAVDGTGGTYRIALDDCDIKDFSSLGWTNHGPFKINGSATVILTLIGTNKIRGITDPAVELASEDANLIINGAGKLTAESLGQRTAIIGSGEAKTGGYITIQSGTVEAIRSYSVSDSDKATNGAAIGSGLYGFIGDITITGGTVIADAGYWGACIGTGYQGYCGNISISGGDITAVGPGTAKGAGIGTGSGGKLNGNITISGGTINASSWDGAGIGGTLTGSILITGGTITASSSSGAGIGADDYGDIEGDVLITGGIITASSGYGNAIGTGWHNSSVKGKITVSVSPTVTFDANGGECSTATMTVEYQGTYGALPEATRTGYIFDGWFTDKTDGALTALTTVTKVDRMNHTLYARWAKKEAETSERPSVADAKAITITVPDAAFTGSARASAVTVKYNGETLVEGTDYTVTYRNNKQIGKATATITGIGRYSGAKTVTFKIVPKKTSISKVTVGAKKFKVTWKAVPAAQKITKYQVRYQVKGAKKWVTKTVSAKKTNLTVRKLVKGKTYQLQVRSYKTVKGAKYHSAWSKAKTSSKI